MKEDRSLVILILLSIITCGIYGIIFWYQYTEDINRACEGDGMDSPNYIVVILLSFITCGIYQFYWYYKQANRLQAKLLNQGIGCQESGTTILMWLLLGSLLCGLGTFVAQYFMIRNMNLLAHDYNQYVNAHYYN
ncbi:MAG: DUF4234 domain-containing protein [Lachnospiraceae bacterium]